MPSINPKVSIILPLFNAEKYIVSALGSLLNQTLGDFEIIVVNDGSRDHGVDKLKKYILERSEKRVRILQNDQNMGLSYTLNRGIKESKGEYIARMDGDDLCTPDRLEQQVKFLDQNTDVDIVGTGMKTFGKTFPKIILNPKTDEEIKVALLFDCAMTLVMMRRSRIAKFSLEYDSNFNGAEDYEMWTRCSKVLKMANIQKPLFHYRIHATQETSARKEITNQKARLARESYLEMMGIRLNPSSLATHHSVAHFDFSTISDGHQLSAWKNELTETIRINRIELMPALEKQLKLRFTRAYYENSNHSTLRKWVIENHLFDSSLLPYREKTFYIFKSFYKKIKRVIHA